MELATFDRRRLPEGASLSIWRAPDGWEQRRMDWAQPAEAAPRGSLIFAGGRGDFIEKYVEAHAHWHARGWNVTSFDWRSQGGSRGDIAGGHLDSLDSLVDDLAALIADWLTRSPGPHAVIAHSMGGHVLLRTLAERHPGIDAAVLVAPMVLVNSSPLPRALAAPIAATLTAIGLGHRPAWKAPRRLEKSGSKRQYFLTGSAERYSDELWWWDRQPGYNLGAPSWGWLNAAYVSSARLGAAALARISVPTLFLGTERDRLVSPSEIRRAAGEVPGAELIMFPDSGHEILRERDSIRLAALARIDTFLDARASA